MAKSPMCVSVIKANFVFIFLLEIILYLVIDGKYIFICPYKVTISDNIIEYKTILCMSISLKTLIIFDKKISINIYKNDTKIK
ncbi:MAG: hypothetical protein LBC92_00020 [Rickettsiales bacterium]|nr:hypothetical protein [Rickettsiales bacterium]